MSDTPQMQPHATTLFCDDLRQELGGKLSAIGIYQGAMVLPGQELLLPKLVAWTAIDLPRAWPGGHVEVRLFDRDQLLAEAEFDVGEITSQGEHAVMNVPLTSVPFAAKVGMVLHVTLSAPGINHRSTELRVVALEENGPVAP